MTVNDVPLVDISGFEDGDPDTRARIAAAVAEAVEGIGFLSITGHGIDQALLDRISGQCGGFFDLPEQTKLGFTNAARNVNRGYVPYGDEFVASSHNAPAPPDYREALAFGRFDLPDDPYYRHSEAGYAYEPNVWPAVKPELVETVKEYYSALEGLNRRLLGIFAVALDLDPAFFLDKFDRHASVLRAINYPEQDPPPAEGQLRCGAHSDFGTHTLLLINDAPGGLQVRNRAGDWVDVDPPPGSFVVNIGDLMMVWTNDRWLSNLHRVVNPPADLRTGTRRQSLAFFVQPNYDALIECIQTCQSLDQPARHKPVKAWQHRHSKLSKTTAESNA